ncbi:MFS transporter [Corynebacterium stationis]|uniref:MFS transporter n=1 Tax=Corynebacterium stationis TaxID=1705 RepID=UPI00095203D9|nr:MFS transporter [Corynebacterium stationis]
MSDNRINTVPNRALRKDDVIVADKKALRQAQIGAGVGNFVEWYDIGVYGYLAVTMTAVFTAGMDQSMGLVVTLLGFAVSFIVRPLGGMVLGPLGDKIGRRKVLFFTIALMAGATTLIGLLPTSETAGLWVIVPLYLLKMLQGFSTGGEYSGASTYIAEFSPDNRRGFMTALLNSGSQLGFAAGAGMVALTSAITTSYWGEDAMIEGGWRIPFLMALPLGILAVALRSKTPESPAFELAEEMGEKAAKADLHPMFERHGLKQILRRYWPMILIGVALIAADGSSSYMLTSYLPTYIEIETGVHASHTAVAAVIVLVIQAILIPFFGILSDKIGRRPVYFLAAGGNIVLLFPAFAVAQMGTVWSLYAVLFMLSIPSALFLANTGAVMAELFPTASRYGCVGFTHNIAISMFGGTTPLFSQMLLNKTGNAYAPAMYVMFFSVIALVAIWKMRESAHRPLLGSVPIVECDADVEHIVENQDSDPNIETCTMPLEPIKTEVPAK